MKQSSIRVVLSLSALCILWVACVPTPSPSPSPTLSTPSPTKTTTATATNTLSPTPTEPPTHTPTTPPTPTIIPSLTPLPTYIQGIRVAYTCEENLCLYNGATQENQLLTQEGTAYKPLFSPDGTKVLYRYFSYNAETGPRFQLRIIDLETNVTTVLVENTQLYQNSSWWQLDWTPDGEAIAFNAFGDPFEYPGPQYDDLWMVDIATGKLTQVLAPGQGGKFAFSPDGTHLVVSTPNTISMLRRDGSARRVLVTFPHVGTGSDYQYRPMPSWATDSSHAMAAIPGIHGDSTDTPYATLWHLPLNGPATQGITVTGSFLLPSQKDGIWSPDNRYMVYDKFATEKGSPYYHALIIALGDGTQPEIYATDSHSFWAWSPDSRHFICMFAQEMFAQGHDIHLCAVDKPPIHLLSLPETTTLLDARWIDTERILCVLQKEKDERVYIQALHVDGTLATLATLIRGATRGYSLDVFAIGDVP